MVTAAGCGGGKAVAPVNDLGSGPRWRPPVHTVVPGDTLYGVAWRYGLDYRQLARWNHLTPPYRILAGGKLRLTAPAATRDTGSKSRITARRAARNSPRKTARQASVDRLGKAPSRWHWPLAKPRRIVRRYAPQLGNSRGLDIAGKTGQPVLASAGGTVVYAGNGLPSLGNLLIIKHSADYLSAYAYCQKLLLREGDTVRAGQPIATAGGKGDIRGLLHFEIRRNGQPIDPLPLLR